MSDIEKYLDMLDKNRIKQQNHGKSPEDLELLYIEAALNIQRLEEKNDAIIKKFEKPLEDIDLYKKDPIEYNKGLEKYLEYSNEKAISSLLSINPQWNKDNPQKFEEMLDGLPRYTAAEVIGVLAEKDKDWCNKNPEKFQGLALKSLMSPDPYSGKSVPGTVFTGLSKNIDWFEQHPKLANEIVEKAIEYENSNNGKMKLTRDGGSSPLSTLQVLTTKFENWCEKNPELHGRLISEYKESRNGNVLNALRKNKNWCDKHPEVIAKFDKYKNLSNFDQATKKLFADKHPEIYNELLMRSVRENAFSSLKTLEQENPNYLKNNPETHSLIIQQAAKTSTDQTLYYVENTDLSNIKDGGALKKAVIAQNILHEKSSFFQGGYLNRHTDECISVMKEIGFEKTSKYIPNNFDKEIYGKIIEAFSNKIDTVIPHISTKHLDEQKDTISDIIEKSPKEQSGAIFDALDKRLQEKKDNTGETAFCLDSMIKLQSLNKDNGAFKNRLEEMRFSGTRDENLSMQKSMKESMDRVGDKFDTNDTNTLAQKHFMPKLMNKLKGRC